MLNNSYHEVLNQVLHLSLDEQQQLLEDLTAMLKQRKAAQPLHSLLELEGLGKKVWKGVDVDKYIEQERNSWDG